MHNRYNRRHCPSPRVDRETRWPPPSHRYFPERTRPSSSMAYLQDRINPTVVIRPSNQQLNTPSVYSTKWVKGDQLSVGG
ncbi:hypothetical protein AN958_02499 [Leucoagaricus sp. SymC.cos]|nr:hypothetical protein AN958_02499 [Leucoagaricus sp. SymC.cos]